VLLLSTLVSYKYRQAMPTGLFAEILTLLEGQRQAEVAAPVVEVVLGVEAAA